MLLDYNIPMMAQPFDAQGTFDNALLNGQNLNTMRQQPLNNELLSQKVNSGRHSAMDDEMKSIYQAAQVVNKYTTNKDLNGATRFLTQRKADLQRQGLNTADTDHALQLAQAGDLQGLHNAAADAITLGEKMMGNSANFQFGASYTGMGSDGQQIITPRYNPNTGAVDLIPSAVSGTLTNKEGVTPQQQIQNKIQEAAGTQTVKNAADLNYAGPIAGSAAAAKANVEASTAPKIAADVTLNTERAKATEEQRKTFIQSGIIAKQNIPKIEKLIKLNDAISGGKVEVWKKWVTDITGSTSPTVGEFQNIARGMVMDSIKSFGANPTEGERKYMMEVQANLEAGQEVNNVILRNMKAIQEAQLSRAQKLQKNKSLTVEDLLLNELDAPIEKSGATRTGIPFTVRQVK